MRAVNPLPRMSNTAFAGFLKLLLTPLHQVPRQSVELQAYLDYLNRAQPRVPTAGRLHCQPSSAILRRRSRTRASSLPASSNLPAA
jgi:hypothetical protein